MPISASTAGNQAPSDSLAEHVAAIRNLGKQTIDNVIDIGRRLTKCKDIVGARNFGCWLDKEFNWSERHARNFMYAYELAESKSENFSELDLPVSSLYLLAAPSTPDPVREEIIERAKAGEKLPVAEVKRIVDAHKSRTAPKRSTIPGTFRKLGDEVKATIKGTSLDNAGGMDEPVMPRAKTVTEPPPVSDEVLQQRAASAERIRALLGKPSAREDIGAGSATEVARLQARIDELQAEVRQRDIKIIGLESEVEERHSQFEHLQKEVRSLLLQLAAAQFQVEELKTKHRFSDVTGKPFLTTIVELDLPVAWTAKEIIADIQHPNLTPDHLRRAAELLHHIADALAVRDGKKAVEVTPVPADDDPDIPEFLRRYPQTKPEVTH